MRGGRDDILRDLLCWNLGEVRRGRGGGAERRFCGGEEEESGRASLLVPLLGVFLMAKTAIMAHGASSFPCK